MDTLDKADRMFDELRRAIPKTYQKERHCQAWISPETWSLIDTRMEARHQKDQRSSRALSRAIKAELHRDRRRRAAESGSTVGCYLALDDALTIEGVVAANGKRPWGGALMVVGHFNTTLVEPEELEQDEGFVAYLEEEGLDDMTDHFLPRHTS